jgi:hypothetical protein
LEPVHLGLQMPRIVLKVFNTQLMMAE